MLMSSARHRQHGAVSLSETSQLLLVVSDGRGLFLEGMERVRTAVRQAREANVFLVFVILDNPENKVGRLSPVCNIVPGGYTGPCLSGHS